ncbi:adenosylcobinamide-GDP ribazoletransferase [Mesobacillus harenae]|uniref:adenosylcobinamide-GDP ribazoletransferase n=1 Tax=Mesobacillus harenae TaxID=2213203 RepID=UPI00158050D4|nr:adenosylcobinamide-GDP ribazoletransferase [Mesobacillus harenae]
MSWLKGLLINLQFFTTIPIPFALPMDEGHIRKAIKTFPLLGLFQGAIYAFLLFMLIEWSPFSNLTAAFFVWLAAILLTGGIHLDGWIDASDAFFSYRDQEKRLEIMKDPRTGAFGVLSVIVLLAAKFLFIYETIQMLEPLTYIFIVFIPFFSKMVMGALLVRVKAAKKEGLGSLFKKAAKKYTLVIFPIYLMIILAAAALLSLQTLSGIVCFIVVSFLLLLILQKKIIHWFGGLTGDVLGASSEGTEVLLWMTLWLLHYFAMG